MAAHRRKAVAGLGPSAPAAGNWFTLSAAERAQQQHDGRSAARKDHIHADRIHASRRAVEHYNEALHQLAKLTWRPHRVRDLRIEGS
jgi:hypothetical protein